MSQTGADVSPHPPQVVPDPGWIPLDPPNLEGGRGSFVSGEPAGGRLRVRYFRREGQAGLVGRAWFGPGAEGPPGHAHGGAVAAVLDEAMGSAAWVEGHPMVMAHLATDFRRMLPLGTDARLEARVTGVDGRKVHLEGRLVDEGGQAYAEATGLGVVLEEERSRELLDRAAAAMGLTPEELRRRIGAWKR